LRSGRSASIGLWLVFAADKWLLFCCGSTARKGERMAVFDGAYRRDWRTKTALSVRRDRQPFTSGRMAPAQIRRQRHDEPSAFHRSSRYADDRASCSLCLGSVRAVIPESAIPRSRIQSGAPANLTR